MRPAIASSKQSVAWAGTDSRWLARAGFMQPACLCRLDDMAHAPGIIEPQGRARRPNRPWPRPGW